MEDSNNNLENNHQDKKKMIMAIVIGAVTLLIAIIGATYAYFQVSTSNNNTNSNVTVKTGKPGTATLKPGIGDLHIILNNVDMSETNSGKEYYADDTKNYVDNETDGTHTISSIEITNGDSDVSYKCTADVEVSLNTDAGSMGEALKAGDVLLNINGKEIDLYNVKETNPITVNLSFRISGNSSKDIQAYAKLINKDEPQNYLTDEDGKQLEIQLTSKNLDCDIAVPDPKIAFLRSKDTNGTLSKDIVGDMYRYQGADNVNNYICFGTTENCGTNEELIDKYMYRIIGITEEGQMKLIKETGVKEDEINMFSWNDKCYEYECSGEICSSWPNSLIYKRINGISNGSIKGNGVCNTSMDDCDGDNTDIFVDSEYYDYLKSGDGINGGNEESNWYKLIENHNWKYGIVRNSDEFGGLFSKWYFQDGVGELGNVDLVYNLENEFGTSVSSKIALMYLYDYYYSFNDENKTWIEHNYTCEVDDYSCPGIWSISLSTQRSDAIWESTGYHGFRLPLRGHYSVYNDFIGAVGTIKPVFYLKNGIQIASGDGIDTNPYILDVQG